MKQKKTRVLTFAYLANNVGDDLFVDTLCRRYPDALFYVSQGIRRNPALLKLPNIRPSWRVSLYSKLMFFEMRLRNHHIKTRLPSLLAPVFVSAFPLAVYIAGSVFVQKMPNWDFALRQHMVRCRAVDKYFIIGANFGPYLDPRYPEGCKKLFENTTDVCFRDSYSKSLFPGLDTVRWAPDVVFSTVPAAGTKRKRTLISVIYCARNGRPAALAAVNGVYEQKVGQMAGILANQGYEVRLVSFCEAQGDGEAAERILAACGTHDGRISVLHYNGDYRQILEEFAQSECVIASRFHAMILGWQHGCKVMPLVYDGKMTHVLDDNSFWHGYDIGDMPSMDAQAAVARMLELPIPDCSDLHVRAQEQFSALDAVLRNGKRRN